ncbi:cell wall metabolism sensor histidine kinase WalK [Brevibacillus sp. HB2.2]|uniref:sensor histidine kinase n=1 Tax=Brevibacillus sp. HB2.2 TaxID=2738846 RepID=UPI00156A8983|nr:HAMP domain-containing sensor histidine kinase [Brevibacillus sp. HB2.2]NRS46393.1 HAMP domain-containing histidine kinase [Brevibacillus sp. HB2.2]
MKFWQRIFLCTLIIFEIFFVPASIYLINSSFELNLNMEIRSGISEQDRFANSLESNLYLLKVQKSSTPDAEGVGKPNIDSMIRTYLDNLGEQDVYLDVIDEKNEVIFSHFKNNKITLTNREELNIPSDKVNYIIRDLGEKTYLFIAKNIYLENNHYKLSYVKDISSVYENREDLLSLLIKLNALVSAILVIVTIIMSMFIVKPINKLIQSTRIIAGGNFSERVMVKSNDEIGLLAENFNLMAADVEDKVNQLKRSSEDKQRFIDNLVHELRTPLTSIIGYADYLRTNKYNEETYINSLSFIYEEGKRLEKLTFKLMELIVLRKEDFELKTGKLDELFVEIKHSFIPKLNIKNIDLEISSEHLSVFMDKDLMKILLANLIDNAIKASKNNDKILLRSYRDTESRIILEVKDTGIGIPDDDITKVFEPFFMSDKSRSRANGGGLGLGLSLCKEIANIHDAEMRIESKFGEGTIIQLVFHC